MLEQAFSSSIEKSRHKWKEVKPMIFVLMTLPFGKHKKNVENNNNRNKSRIVCRIWCEEEGKERERESENGKERSEHRYWETNINAHTILFNHNNSHKFHPENDCINASSETPYNQTINNDAVKLYLIVRFFHHFSHTSQSKSVTFSFNPFYLLLFTG